MCTTKWGEKNLDFDPFFEVVVQFWYTNRNRWYTFLCKTIMTNFKAKLRKKLKIGAYFQKNLVTLQPTIEPNSWLIHLKRCYLNYLLLVNSRKIR